jgi:large subunit ribosomal protein L25
MEFKLKAEKREKNEKLTPDYIPAILYGKGVENQNLKLKKVDFEKIYSAAGESNLIDLDFGTGALKVLIKDTQRDVLKYTFTHVDFYQVNMKEKVTTEIPFEFVGEAKAVRELGGMLMREMDSIKVECLPSDLVDHIDVDLSVLATFDDVITVADLALPAGFELKRNNPEDLVAKVIEPKVQEVEEEKPAEETVEAAAPTEDKEKEKEEEKK